MSFQEFDTTKIEQAQQKYAQEAAERWGNTAAYQQSSKRTSGYSKEDWARISGETEQIYRGLAAQMDKPVSDPTVQQLVKEWQDLISRNFYDCTDGILAGLGEMYTADERFAKNINQYGDGLAQFLSDAIRCYCAGH